MKLLLILLIGIIIIVNIPIYIEFKIRRKKKNYDISIKISLLWGLIKLQNQINNLDIVTKFNEKRKQGDDKKSESYMKVENNKLTIDYLIEQFHRLKKYQDLLKDVIQYIVDKIDFISFNLNSKLGLGDAALTGIAYGVLWAIISVIINAIFSVKEAKNLSIYLYPDFNETTLEIDFSCIIKIKIAHIIIASIKGIKVLIKGGVLNGRSSYSRINENNYGKY